MHTFGNGFWIVRNRKINRDHTNYGIFVIGLNSDKSHRYLKRLAIVQTSVKDHQLMLLWGTPQEYQNNTRHDGVGKVIYWELWKKFILKHMNKSYMHDPASVLENESQNLLDFDIQKDNLTSARWLHLIIMNNKKENMLNCVQDWVKLKESERRISSSILLGNWKKTTSEHESNDNTNCNWRS